MTREPLYAAVFAFFSALTVGASPAFATATRKIKTWEDCGIEQQPALLMRQMAERSTYKKGFPLVWRCDIALMLYVHTGAQMDDTVVPSQLLNPLLDAIEAAVRVDDPGNQAATLGGLVSHCAIEGDVQIFEGSLGDEAVAVVPLMFLTS